MTPAFEDELCQIYLGDCLEVLRELPDASVDALVTDPPAGIGFMGKDWDNPNRLGYPITETGFTDGGHRLLQPSIKSNKNPTCRTCGGRQRGGPKTRTCDCDTPDWDITEKLQSDRAIFIDFMTTVMFECLRVLKPGAHGLVWAIPRTSHWTATALEDAGFEVRDVITHHFGSGFPKSLDVSKAIDKAAGAERTVISTRVEHDITRPAGGGDERFNSSAGQREERVIRETAPATPEAQRWAGWGTALKPASEHWILVRKPLSEPNVAANVLRFGTGAINIDGTRISTNGEHPTGSGDRRGGSVYAQDAYTTERMANGGNATPPTGRWPANLILSHSPDCKQVGTRKVKGANSVGERANEVLVTGYGGGWDRHKPFDYNGPDGREEIAAWECTDGCPVAELDRQSGQSGEQPRILQRNGERQMDGWGLGASSQGVVHGDTGGASRFFYTAKADRAERNAGLEGLPERPLRADNGNPGHLDSLEDSGQRVARNHHPTVKPVDLMRYLCRMITPPGGTVLDPFLGSGTTLVAAKIEGFHGIGIEREADYVEIAKRRLGWAVHEPELFA